MRYHKILIMIVIFGTSFIPYFRSESILFSGKYVEVLPEKNYFDLSNETKSILDTVIYDTSLNYTAFVFSNVTDSGLIVSFGKENTTLHSNESFFREKLFENIVLFKLHSKGNSSGYYWVRWNYCCSVISSVKNGTGTKTINDLLFFRMILALSVISIVLRRKRSIK